MKQVPASSQFENILVAADGDVPPTTGPNVSNMCALDGLCMAAPFVRALMSRVLLSLFAVSGT